MQWQRRLGAAALCFQVAVGAACAQSVSTIAKVEFHNAGNLAPEDLQRVAGIHPGSTVGLAQMQAAAQHLADTGMFDDVHLDSSGPPSALTLKFLLKPATNLTLFPAVYENFAWLSPAEMQAAVHDAAPLLRQDVPENDAILEGIAHALEVALGAKGVVGAQVSHVFVPATDEVPIGMIAFRVDRPGVRVGAVKVEGVPAELQAQVGDVASKLKGTLLVTGALAGSDEDRLLAPLRNAGYVRAKVLEEHTALQAQGTGAAVTADLSLRVDPEQRYRVGLLRFEPTAVVTAEAFASGQKLHSGDVASRSLLLQTEAPVQAAYQRLGYMYALVDPGATWDDASQTVSYALHVVPGEAYTVRSVTVQGLSPAARAQFDSAWKMNPGAPYDAGAVSRFLANNSAIKALQGYAGGFQAATDPEKHVVDLTINFVAAQ